MSIIKLATTNTDYPEFQFLTGAPSASDIASGTMIIAVDSHAMKYVFNPGTKQLEIARTPSKWVTAAASATVTAWVPANGKRFRVLAYDIDIPADCTGNGAEITLSLYDGSSPMNMVFRDYFPNSAPTNATADVHHTRGLKENGYLSLAVNNPLVVRFSSSLTSGLVQFNFSGTEE